MIDLNDPNHLTSLVVIVVCALLLIGVGILAVVRHRKLPRYQREPNRWRRKRRRARAYRR